MLGRRGRLGNQMFQYAALLGIARRMGYDFCIPASDAADLWNQHQLFQAFDLPSLTRIGVNTDEPQVWPRHFHFDPEIAYACPDDVDVIGYLQTQRYFRGPDPADPPQVRLPRGCAGPCRQAIAAIGPEVISLQVRHTDYVEHPGNHPPLEITYYPCALDLAPPRMPVLVFSDEVGWCKAQPLFEGARFALSEGRDNIADICLMSLCRHHILANSSFSWWTPG